MTLTYAGHVYKKQSYGLSSCEDFDTLCRNEVQFIPVFPIDYSGVIPDFLSQTFYRVQ